MSPLQAASLEERVAELESDLANLAAAAQAAEDQAVDLMQQVQAARAGESAAARESAALAEQARRITTHINLVRAFMRRMPAPALRPVPRCASHQSCTACCGLEPGWNKACPLGLGTAVE